MTALFAEIEAADQYGWHFDAEFLARRPKRGDARGQERGVRGALG
jgi:hypothetical protein